MKGKHQSARGSVPLGTAVINYFFLLTIIED